MHAHLLRYVRTYYFHGRHKPELTGMFFVCFSYAARLNF